MGSVWYIYIAHTVIELKDLIKGFLQVCRLCLCHVYGKYNNILFDTNVTVKPVSYLYYFNQYIITEKVLRWPLTY